MGLDALNAWRRVARMVDRKLKRALDRDGYVVARGLLNPDATCAVLSDCREVLRLQASRHGVNGASADGAAFDAALGALFRVSMPSYLAAAKLTQYLPSLHRLGVDETLLGLIRRLGVGRPVISTRPVVHIVSDDLKVPGGYHRTPPHQDWRSVQGSLDALVAWVPLVAAGPESSPLEVAPGSHRLGLLPAVPHPFGTTVADGQLPDDAFVPVDAAPGDVVVFSMFLVHRTGLSQRPGVRWAVSYRYNNLDEPSFVGRDYPNPYVYRPKDELLVEGFPTADDIRRIFGEG
jgi:ectoine hydroxylase-related dioxygenase (phytanoyl-CoA dioxygenase family)